MDKKILGNTGEVLAQQYLVSKGYKIIDTNWRYSNIGEIDIIAIIDKDLPILAFIEVKTRSSTKFAYPVESVGAIKQKRIKKLSSIYISINNLNDINVRFDVVEIIITNTEQSLNHLEGAFW